MSNSTQKNTKLSVFVDYVELFVIAVCIVIVLFSVFFRTCNVDGNSMNNTLFNGEVVVVSDMFYTPQREDIIVFHQTNDSMYDKNKPLVKRVIGIGGDTVKIDYDEWTITIIDKNGNSTVLSDDYVHLSSRGSYFTGVKEYEVPEGSLFVLGDNRNDSLDSRYADIGFVDARRVLGKVVFRVSPISRFGAVD